MSHPEDSPCAVIFWVSGAGVGDRGCLRVALVPGELGRDPGAGLHLDDPRISGRHARLLPPAAPGDPPRLEDLGSANGLWTEGGTEDLAQVVLRPGLVLILGDTRLQVLAWTEERPAIVRVGRPGSPGTRHVVRLPCALSERDDGVLCLAQDPVDAGSPALLLADEAGLALVVVEGSRIRTLRPDAEGVLAHRGHWLRAAEVREFPSLPTDLVFDAQELKPGQTVIRVQTPDFPPAAFARRQVGLEELAATGLPIEEIDYLALGGGLGSFSWVDALRVHGVASRRIRAVGFETLPYARYARLCAQSQIPLHERLRSNSESCPDNLWGFPGYGLREAVSQVLHLRLLSALRTTAQLSFEPDLATTWTPRAGQVFASIDREARRIGWAGMARAGRIRAVRQTTDGRTVAAVSLADGGHAFFVASVVHLALGYPGMQFLPDLRRYRERTLDFARVVNAYEDHEGIYRRLEARGGTVLLRGRGIVASRVLQRLHEARAKNPGIEVVHLMRKPVERGARAGSARRRTAHHWEFQPFNWPEAAWGGDLKAELARADPARRATLLRAWGGTTTANRPDWRAIVAQGLSRGWYRIHFATVTAIDGSADTLRVSLAPTLDALPSPGRRGADSVPETVKVDVVIDATGLVSDMRANPVLDDLISTYGLPLNPQGRLEVSTDFELDALRNGERGRVYTAGVATLGGPYAPVDSFLGLQHAALASTTHLQRHPDPALRLRPLGPLRSTLQWGRWMLGVAP